MNSHFFNSKIKICLFLAGLCSTTLFSCGKEEVGFNNKEFDISKNNDNSLKVVINHVKEPSGSYYSLNIKGNGVAKDFKETTTPWRSITKQIKQVNFEEGITSLGNYYFNKLKINYYILPNSLTSFTETSFNSDAKLYLKNNEVTINNMNNEVYYYSEQAPADTTKKYWHYVNETPVVWSKIKVLFIGNSFTFYNDIPKMTENIAKSLGYDFVCDSITKGAHTLTQFADPTDEYGKHVYDTLKTKKDYDYVILQDQSTRSYTKYNEFYNACKKLNDLVKETQDHAETRLYATWGYPDGLSQNETVVSQEAKIRDKYKECGASLNIKVHNVGQAFSKIYEENKDINLYFSDNKHPGHLGSFLSSHVHAMSILNIDTRTSTYSSGYSEQENGNWEINAETADILKNCAYTVCFK